MKAKYLVGTILLATLALSCHRERRWHVSSLDRQMIPYQTGDSLCFIDARGNLIRLTVMDETFWWDHYDEYLWEEYKTIHLKSPKEKFSLGLRLQGWNFGNSIKHIGISFHSPFDNGSGSVIYDRTGALSRDEWRHFDEMVNFEYYETWDIYDSVIVGGRTYYEVSFNEYAQPTLATTCYYSKTHGVLQMTTNGDTVFTLQEYIPAR